MKRYGALHKLMFIVVLSILGSYCINACQSEQPEVVKLSIIQSTYDLGASIGAYCYKFWLDVQRFFMPVVNPVHQNNVEIQMIADNVHGNNYYCTDGTDDCVYNEEFFNDTWVTGKVDEDPTTFLDIDADKIVMVAH